MSGLRDIEFEDAEDRRPEVLHAPLKIGGSWVNSVAEAYTEHGAELHVHVGMGGAKVEASEFGVVFERSEGVKPLGEGTDRLLPLRAHRQRWDNKYMPVLVDAVEFVDDSERLLGRYLSVVRLRTLDLCLRGLRGEPSGTWVVLPLVQSDGESDAAPFSLSERWYRGGREVIDDRIERRPQVVEYVADDRAEVRRRLPAYADSVDVLRSISLKVSDDGVGLTFEKQLDGLIERADVFVRPSDLEPCAL